MSYWPLLLQRLWKIRTKVFFRNQLFNLIRKKHFNFILSIKRNAPYVVNAGPFPQTAAYAANPYPGQPQVYVPQPNAGYPYYPPPQQGYAPPPQQGYAPPPPGFAQPYAYNPNGQYYPPNGQRY